MFQESRDMWKKFDDDCRYVMVIMIDGITLTLILISRDYFLSFHFL